MRAKSNVTRRTSNRPDAELPELTDEMLARGVLKKNGRPVGRPKLAMTKVLSLRLAPDTLARWKASGPGWQTRMAAMLQASAPKRRVAARR